MRLKYFCVENFGSYQALEFYLSSLGLVAVSGPTGSGKSTFADIVPWILFGQTSKEGGVDEVRQWGASEPTRGTLILETPTGEVRVTRIRGTAAQNDLYWTEFPSMEEARGKNLLDTQQLLNERIGMDAETYLLGGYFSQFSAADQFFFAKAKERRPILERIADVSTPVSLAERSSTIRKEAKKRLEELTTSRAKLQGWMDALISQKTASEGSSTSWEESHQAELDAVSRQAGNFEVGKAQKYGEILARLERLEQAITPVSEYETALTKNRAEREKLTKKRAEYQKWLPIAAEVRSQLASSEREKARQERLPDSCPECQRPGANPLRAERLAQLTRDISDLSKEYAEAQRVVAALERDLRGEADLDRKEREIRQNQAANAVLLGKFEAESAALEALEKAPNIYADRLAQLNKAENPYVNQLAEVAKRLDTATKDLAAEDADIHETTQLVASIATLYDLSFVLRAEKLRAAVTELEAGTNSRLEKYFDGVFRVKFLLEDSDKLEVEITNNGHVCSFRQLSGGERRQLTLCFWRAMARLAADAAGLSFSLVTMDESFNGLSDELKVKAFRLLEEVAGEAESVVVIDHSPALKSMFDTVFEVEKVGENSVLKGAEQS